MCRKRKKVEKHCSREQWISNWLDTGVDKSLEDLVSEQRYRSITIWVPHMQGRRSFFFRGGKFQKKGTFCSKKGLLKTPTKVVYSNHVAIKLAYSLKKKSSLVVDLQFSCFRPKIIVFSKKKKKVFTCSRSLIFLFRPKIKSLRSKLFFHSKQTSASFASPKIHHYLKLTIFATFIIVP